MSFENRSIKFAGHKYNYHRRKGFVGLKLIIFLLVLAVIVLVVCFILKNKRSVTQKISTPPTTSISSGHQNTSPPHPIKPSIFGTDVSKLPSARLVKLAKLKGQTQRVTVTGIGTEFDPPLLVVQNNVMMYLHYNMKKFDNPRGEYTIINIKKGTQLSSNLENKRSFTLEFRFFGSGSYAVLKDGFVINAIKVVDNLRTVDIDKIRSEFLKIRQSPN